MTRHQTNIIDVSAWAGTWPFDLNGTVTLPPLAERLAKAGIREALVSPLDAVLAPDVMPANRALLADCAGSEGLPVRFHPVPVINPVLPTWRQDLEDIAGAHPGRCPAVRLIPTWHDWGPEHPDAAATLQAIHDLGMMPIVQARMIDERAMPVMASQAVFDAKATAAWLGTLPEIPLVIAGLYRMEIAPFAGFNHVAIDLSFVESDDTLATALAHLPPGRILPGTHAPIFEPLAGAVKLPSDGPTSDAVGSIAHASAREWFPLPR